MVSNRLAARRAAHWLVGVSLALSSTLATAAGQPGWYVGAEGFATAPDDADARASAIPGSNGVEPMPGQSCLLSLGGVTLDLGIPGLCVLGPDVPATPGVDPVAGIPAQNFAYDFKTGFGGGLTFGYRFENGLRPELALNYSTADVDTFTAVTAGTPSAGADGKVEALRLMSSLWYDLDFGRYIPYLGGGIGAQRTETQIGNFIDGKDTTFAFQLGGGVGLLLSDDWTLSLDYRYVDADRPKYRTSLNQPIESEYSSHNLGLGLTYAFGADGGRDTDGDGVPDRRDDCPNTPAGVTVYSNGCPTDVDGDTVPDYLDKCPNTPPGAPINSDGCPIDSDGDGVPDHADQCPGTPPGTPVDTRGCPADADGDGVPDYLDKCPGTQKGVKVDANGCDFRDADGDGVPDSADRCPNTPRGELVGPDGCPLDSDGDGIPDSRDDCPNTPAGYKVLPDGCAPVGDCRKPRPGEPVDARGCALDRRFVLRGVKFEFDSDRLTAPAKETLNEVAATLSAYPDLKLDVEGHTDSLGTDAYNLSLSERRAIAVIRYLGEQGAKTARLKAIGFGETVPIDSNDTEVGRENNRRVEFKVTGD